MRELTIPLFCTQVSIAVIVLTFCIYMLVTHNDDKHTGVYLPVITSIVALFLPSPVTDNMRQKQEEPRDALV